MKYSKLNKRWQIIRTRTDEILAFMNETSNTNIPAGLQKWYFTQSKCTDMGKSYRTLNFHPYVDQPGHFCCNDGACFHSDLVCDGTIHCDKGEDENNCQVINVPRYYDKNKPPSEIHAKVKIVDIMEIQEDHSTFDVYFSLQLTWIDKKLNFVHLKSAADKNIIPEEERENIWVPKINFAFTISTVQDFDTIIFINRTMPVMSGGIDKIYVKEIYDGSETPLVYVSAHNIKFFCSFDKIDQYPFETQTCNFYFYLEGSANDQTYVNCTLKSPPEKVIGQYVTTGWQIKANQTYPRTKKTVVTISVLLTRRLFSIIMVTYLPTFLMNIINQATTFIIVENKYDLIITVNITSMMVLASIYLSVSSSLPSTPSIKPVEIWLLFNLAFPFMVIITNVVLQVYKIDEKMHFNNITLCRPMIRTMELRR